MAMDGSLCLCDWGLIDSITCPKCPKQIRVRWSVIMRLQNLNSSLWKTGFIMRKKDYLGSKCMLSQSRGFLVCYIQLWHTKMASKQDFRNQLVMSYLSYCLCLRKCCHTPNFKPYKYLYITKKFTSKPFTVSALKTCFIVKHFERVSLWGLLQLAIRGVAVFGTPFLATFLNPGGWCLVKLVTRIPVEVYSSELYRTFLLVLRRFN